MGLFAKATHTSVALIDIGSASVGGAYAHITQGASPIVYYTTRVPIEQREGEAGTDAMLRALSLLGHLLINQGAPILHKATGSGRIDRVLTSVSSPWQETGVHAEVYEREQPFVFTARTKEEMLGRVIREHPERILSGAEILASILNGYEVENAVGKKAKRAELIVLSSTIEKAVAEAIERELRTVFHTHEVTLTAFAPLAYAALRDLYPSEKDYLVVEVSASATDLAFVRRGLLSAIARVPQGTSSIIEAVDDAPHAEIMPSEEAGILNPLRNEAFAVRVKQAKESWLAALADALRSCASRHVLPRKVFLIADQRTRGFLEGVLNDPSLHVLWLSDDPISVSALTPADFATCIRARAGGEGDVYTALMALYASRHLAKSGS